MLNVKAIHQSRTPPPLFERGAPMWHDPHISAQMLQFHLDTSHDIASRRAETIDNITGWMMRKLNLSSDMTLLDLGCGPGLYTQRFAEQGLQVTGVDYSQTSIDYAHQHDTHSTYICQDYNALDLAKNQFDVVMMIYGDFCVLSDTERDTLLKNIKHWLKPTGAFVFDVTTPQMHAYLQDYNQWSVALDGGFWKASPYLVLEQGFVYPDDVTMQQYTVIETDGTQTLYRNWYRDYTQQTLTPVLKNNGYNEVDFFADLTGAPYAENSDWIGIIARP